MSTLRALGLAQPQLWSLEMSLGLGSSQISYLPWSLDFTLNFSYNCSMIKYEHKMLVLDSSHSDKDQAAVDLFITQAIDAERDRIYNDLSNYTNGYDSLSIAKFRLRQIINQTDELIY
jgi:hypothetical protein